MRVTIIQEDNLVGVDGEFYKVDLSDLDVSIHAIQFDSAKKVAEIEYDANEVTRRPNEFIDTKTFNKRYKKYVDMWAVAKEQNKVEK